MLQDTDMLWSTLKLILALPVVILLAYISLRLTNQYLTKHNQGKNIQVLERTPINNKASICVVRIGEEFMVMGISENSFEVIKTLDQDEVKDYVNSNTNINLAEAFNININKFKKGKSKHE
jgi:flagellar protein FliO/FliZ